VITFVMIFSATAEKNVVLDELDNMAAFALLALIGSVYIFLAGVALAGWIRSRITGIATTAFVLITVCMVTYVVVRVISLFT
jgi:hypothetical protein